MRGNKTTTNASRVATGGAIQNMAASPKDAPLAIRHIDVVSDLIENREIIHGETKRDSKTAPSSNSMIADVCEIEIFRKLAKVPSETNTVELITERSPFPSNTNANKSGSVALFICGKVQMRGQPYPHCGDG